MDADELMFPRDLQVIADVETLRVVADPLRLQLLAVLRREPATARQLAQQVGVAIKKLYYHLGLLEEHGLIRVRSTRVVSGIIEKQYEPSAYRITVDRDLLSPAAPAPVVPEHIDVFLSFVLDHSRAEIKKSIAAGLIDPTERDHEKGGLRLGRLFLRMRPAQRAEFDRRLKLLFREFAEQQPERDDPEAHYFEILQGIYPIVEEEQHDHTTSQGA